MLPILVPFALVATVVYVAATAVYAIFFHPLAKYPGPKSWLIIPMLQYISRMRGRFDYDMVKFHKKYGPVVRYGLNELSYTTSEAWKEIYGHGRSLPKLQIFESGIQQDIISAQSNSDHTRYRKAIAHAFSEKGLRAQEPIIRKHVDALLTGLKEGATKSEPLDMTMWYNLTTFDIVSDLAFGKTFGCLQSKQYNEYIRAIFGFIQVAPFLRTKIYQPLWYWATVAPWMNSKLVNERANLRSLSKETALERVYDTESAGRGDFMDSMMRHRGDKDGLTDNEIAANANILFIAGSETTATLLSGVTYWLLQNPHAMKRVTAEVRGAFEAEDDITFNAATQKLPYMLACLEEALRMYPPVPGLLARVTQQPTEINGEIVPPNTRVGVHQIASYRSESNFHRAEEFVPERFLAETIKDESSPFFADNRDVLQPFSVGPRNCIGRNLAYNEMRVILARILFNFDIKVSPKTAEWTDQKIMALWVKKPLYCHLSLREGLAA